MLRITLACLFIAQVLATIPDKCIKPPPDMKHAFKCCKVPKEFTDEELKECGIEKPAEGEEVKRGPPDCDKQLCVLKKRNLVKADGSIDKTAIAAFLDQWASKNPSFKDAAEKAKTACTSKEPLPGPPDMCEANKIAHCLFSTIFRNCPDYEQSDVCQKVKAHNDECKQYFP